MSKYPVFELNSIGADILKSTKTNKAQENYLEYIKYFICLEPLNPKVSISGIAWCLFTDLRFHSLALDNCYCTCVACQCVNTGFGSHVPHLKNK